MRGVVRESGTWSSRRIPESWDWVSFEVLFGNTTSSDLKLPRKHYLPEGSIPVVDQGEGLIGGYTENANLVNPTEPPALVFGDHTRAVKYVPFQFVQGADGVKVLKPAETLDPKYAYWALRTIRLPDKGYARHFRFLRASEFPVAPLPEQRRIVAKIEELFSELDAGVAALERARAKLERYRASVLKASVEGRLTEQWRKENPSEETGEDLLKRILAERRKRWEEEQLAGFETKGKKPPEGWREKYKEPEGPDTSGLPELPEGWCWGTVEQIGQVGSGITVGGKNNRGGAPMALPYLRVANVQRGFLDLSEIKEIGVGSEKASRYSLENGDVLFTEGGDRDKLGRGSVWRDEIPGCLHQNHIFRVRLFTSWYAPELLSHQGNSFGQRWFLKYASQTVNLASINQTILRRFPVPVPPRPEQEVLVRKLDEALDRISRLNEALSAQGERTESLRQAILKLAFEGRLVPQDPNDEPASILLERIRASRKAEKPGAKRPRKRKSRQGSLDL